MHAYLLVNFGGPRDLSEVEPFLRELLCDPDVVKTPFPRFFHNWFFRKVAKKRAVKVSEDYGKIGGRSPIYFDTEALASALRLKVQGPVVTFHRYLPMTHAASCEAIDRLCGADIRVLPLFPQFSYATTGSIIKILQKKLKATTVAKLRWIRSYPEDPGYIRAFQRRIKTFLTEKQIFEKDVVLLFSAHGLPASFVKNGDPYQSECERSFHAIRAAFPEALCRLSYQSKFGKGEWLRPYTDEVCEEILQWHEGRLHVVFVPLSFTSDHIETLFEVEELYLPIIQKKGLQSHRCPALNLEPDWIDAVANLLNAS